MPHARSECAVPCDISIAFLIYKKLRVHIFKVIFISNFFFFLHGLLVPLDLEE